VEPDLSSGVQQEVAPRVSIDRQLLPAAGAGNFQATDNRAVSASDYTKYSIVAPSQDAFNALGAKIPLPGRRGGRTDERVLRSSTRTRSAR
jgi:hypothetical protein